ncbi:MAG: lipase maturation factor family protein [Phycisphaerales bacterium]|nr:lipase maturation factor family protein [Phycisphaerales bacterium]
MSSCGGCTGCAKGCGSGPPISQTPGDRPLVVWDGECTFCRRWASRWYALTGDTFAWTTLQKRPGSISIEREALASAIHLVEPDGTHVRGAEAVCTILARGGVRGWPLVLYRHVPGVARVSEAVYNWVARHRGGCDRASRALLGKVEIPDTWQLTRRVFLRCMGLIWLIAFLSLGHQLDGLIGADGLQPITGLIETFTARAPDMGFMNLPTLQWFGGDGLLQATWIIGVVAALSMVVGLVPLLSAALCWALYLSLVNAAGVFTGYPWDMLLLEAGLLAVCFSPGVVWLHSPRASRPSAFIRLLLTLLLIKLMVLSGLVKLSSQDPVWADCTALSYHYWTQPLPWWPAWWAMALPEWVLKLACEAMFVAELWLPWLLLLGRIPRLIAACSIIALQLGIAATGNYGFFNWLTIVLALAAIDDAMLLLLWPRAARHLFKVGVTSRPRWWRRCLVLAAGIFICSISLPRWYWHASAMPNLVAQWSGMWWPWHVASNYGLFATMTTTRPEVTLEVSTDNEHWTPVRFRYKPGPLDEAPRFCQPGMPRLDWQLWFDALAYERLHDAGVLTASTAWQRFRTNIVLPDLTEALIRRSASVGSLLAPDQPHLTAGNWLRWSLWQYAPADSADTGDQWWTRRLIMQSPPIRMDATD